jgi:UDP-N-acetylglucosamine 2-epimerase (non-hydrolysing)
VTDGGSNQEECFYMGKPCLLMRKATERQEWIWENVIISEYKDKIINDFILNYNNYKKDLIINKESPTDMIIDFITKKI